MITLDESPADQKSLLLDTKNIFYIKSGDVFFFFIFLAIFGYKKKKN